jgi:Transglycosylase SLT domain
MADYTFAQLETLWINAGGAKLLAPLMAGVAIVESGGNPNAYNPSGASGLWQIEIPLHSNLVPGGAANVFNPADNAKAAVALSGNTLAGITANWLNFEPPGAAEAIVTENGGTVPAALPASSSGSSSSAAVAQLTSFTPGDLLDPGGVIKLFQSAWDEITTGISGAADIASSVTSLAKNFNILVGLIDGVLTGVEWLFVPSHWVRIWAGLFGVAVGVPGLIMLMKVGNGQQGDVTLAMGILMIVVSGVLLFIAFHNLPSDVKNLQGLTNYISEGISTGQAPAS